MEATQQTQELTIIEKSLEIFQSGGDILRNNISRAGKAEAVGQKILADITAAGGIKTPEMDERCQKYLVNCANAKKEMDEARKPLTQIIDLVKAEFTNAEKKVDVKAATAPASVIQTHRNNYASFLLQEKKRLQDEADRKAKRDQESVSIKAECERRLSKYCGDYLSKSVMDMNETFNKITLDNYEGIKASLLTWPLAYPYQHFTEFKHSLYGQLNTPAEVETIVLNVTAGAFDGYAQTYKTTISDLQLRLIEHLPSKKAELQQIADTKAEQERLQEEQRQLDLKISLANAEEKEKLEAEKRESERKEREQKDEQERIQRDQEQREQQERQRLENDQQQQQLIQQQTIDMNQRVDETLVLFDKEAAVSIDTPAPEARVSYDIEVTHPAGYMLIFQFWFENEGKNLAIDKIGNTKMDQMKGFCEKYALKTGTKIESQFLKYKDAVKSVNRKAK